MQHKWKKYELINIMNTPKGIFVLPVKKRLHFSHLFGDSAWTI